MFLFYYLVNYAAETYLIGQTKSMRIIIQIFLKAMLFLLELLLLSVVSAIIITILSVISAIKGISTQTQGLPQLMYYAHNAKLLAKVVMDQHLTIAKSVRPHFKKANFSMNAEILIPFKQISPDTTVFETMIVKTQQKQTQTQIPFVSFLFQIHRPPIFYLKFIIFSGAWKDRDLCDERISFSESTASLNEVLSIVAISLGAFGGLFLPHVSFATWMYV